MPNSLKELSNVAGDRRDQQRHTMILRVGVGHMANQSISQHCDRLASRSVHGLYSGRLFRVGNLCNSTIQHKHGKTCSTTGCHSGTYHEIASAAS